MIDPLYATRTYADPKSQVTEAEIGHAVRLLSSPAGRAANELIEVFAKEAQLKKRLLSRAEPDACWIFRGPRMGDGYGAIRVHPRVLRAHRVAYMLANKRPIPPGIVVRHTCDNRLCVNAAHLNLGTHGENGKDRRERGNYMPKTQKLHYLDAQEIREFYKAGVSVNALADVYGVSVSGIQKILNGETYRKWPGWKPYENCDRPDLCRPLVRVRIVPR